MVTPINNFQPPQPFAPAQSGASTPTAPGETALVLNINSPLIKHDNGAGNDNNAAGANNGQTPDLFQRKTIPPCPPNPNATPAQRLQDLYAKALADRNAAEQTRTEFLNEAGQLENQALGKSAQPAPASPQPAVSSNPFAQSPLPMQPANPAPQPTFQAPAPPAPQPDPTQQFQQQLQNLQQQQPQQPQQPAQPQPPAYDPMAQQQQAPAYDPMAQQQMLAQQQAGQPGQPGQMDPMQQQMMQQAPQPGQMAPGQQGFAGGGTAEWNGIISQPTNPMNIYQKNDAITNIANSQLADRQTYELLKQEASNSAVPPGVNPDEATALRQTALIALGSLNGSPVNAKLAGKDLYGMDAINQILSNPNENPLVKASALTSLSYMNRPQDPTVQKLEKIASKDPNPDVQRAYEEFKQAQMQAGGVPAKP